MHHAVYSVSSVPETSGLAADLRGHAPPTSTAESEAIRLARTGNLRQRLRLAARAGFRLVRDPEDTQQVFILGISLNAARVPALIGIMAAHDSGLALLGERPTINSEHVDFQRLRRLPAGTLGREYVRFLDDNQLDADFFREPPGLPAAVGFMARRLRQTHDIWHVITGHGSDVGGEVALQAFTYGQTRMPSALAIAILGCARNLLRDPGLPRRTVSAYRRGARAAFLPAVRWEDLWEMPLDELRQRFQIVVAQKPAAGP